jgi:phosphosulfolactate synthase (CoM biosynthesis protein A)
MAKEKSFEELVEAAEMKQRVKREVGKRYRASKHYRADLLADATHRRVAQLVNASKAVDTAARQAIKGMGLDVTPTENAAPQQPETQGVENAATA